MTYGASIPSHRLRLWGESTFPATLRTTLRWMPNPTGQMQRQAGC
jgi:hypothetical protein